MKEDTTLMELSARKDALMNDILVLQQRQIDYLMALDELSESMKKRDEIVVSLNREKLNLEEMISQSKSECIILSTKQEQVKNLESNILSLSEKLISLESDINSKKEEYNAVVNGLVTASKKLEEFLSNVEKEKKEKELEIKKLNDTIKKSIDDKNKQLKEVEDKENEIKENIELMDADIELKQEKISVLDTKLLITQESISEKNSILDNILLAVDNRNKLLLDLEKNIAEAKIALGLINSDIISGNNSLEEIKVKIKDADEKLVTEEKKLDQIIIKGGYLIAKEDYLSGKELFIEEQFKRLGLEFQPYVKS